MAESKTKFAVKDQVQVRHGPAGVIVQAHPVEGGQTEYVVQYVTETGRPAIDAWQEDMLSAA